MFVLGCATMLRVVVLISLAALVWVPVGVWIGLRPALVGPAAGGGAVPRRLPGQPDVPGARCVLIVHWHLNPDIWLSPLMVFGTQWYLLFNVIAGASSIPSELRFAAGNLGLTGWLRWRRFLLPAVFPSFVTGAITASGGSWNASIVSEYVTWGNTTLRGQRPGQLHRAHDRRRRLPPHRAGHLRDVHVRDGHEPLRLAAAVPHRRRPHAFLNREERT